MDNIKRIIQSINEKCLKTLIEHSNRSQSTNSSIEFENEVGKWKIESNRHIYLQPKQSIKYIETNITILPTNQQSQ